MTEPATGELLAALAPFERRLRGQRAVEALALGAAVALPLGAQGTWAAGAGLLGVAAVAAWAWPLDKGRVARHADREAHLHAAADTALHLAARGHPAAAAVAADAVDQLRGKRPPGLRRPRARWLSAAGALLAGLLWWHQPAAATPSSAGERLAEHIDRLAGIENKAWLEGDEELAEAARELREILEEAEAQAQVQQLANEEVSGGGPEAPGRGAAGERHSGERPTGAPSGEVDGTPGADTADLSALSRDAREVVSELVATQGSSSGAAAGGQSVQGAATGAGADLSDRLDEALDSFAERWRDGEREDWMDLEGPEGQAKGRDSKRDGLGVPGAGVATEKPETPKEKAAYKGHEFSSDKERVVAQTLGSLLKARTMGGGTSGAPGATTPGGRGGGHGDAQQLGTQVDLDLEAAGGAEDDLQAGRYSPGSLDPEAKERMLAEVASRAALVGGGGFGAEYGPYFSEAQRTVREEAMPPRMAELIAAYFKGIKAGP